VGSQRILLPPAFKGIAKLDVGYLCAVCFCSSCFIADEVATEQHRQLSCQWVVDATGIL